LKVLDLSYLLIGDVIGIMRYIRTPPPFLSLCAGAVNVWKGTPPLLPKVSGKTGFHPPPAVVVVVVVVVVVGCDDNGDTLPLLQKGLQGCNLGGGELKVSKQGLKSLAQHSGSRFKGLGMTCY